jgi:hypothetical protein
LFDDPFHRPPDHNRNTRVRGLCRAGFSTLGGRAMTAYQQQMGTDAADGASAIGAVRRLACSAHKFQTGVQTYWRRSISLAPTIPPEPCTGGGCQASPVLFLHSSRGASKARDRRRVQGFSSPLAHGSVATHSRRFISSRLQSRLVQHVRRQTTDAHEGHVVNASLVRWFNATTDRTEATRKNGNPFQQEE